MKNNSSGCLIFLIVIAIAVIISIILENPIFGKACPVAPVIIRFCISHIRKRPFNKVPTSSYSCPSCSRG